MRRTGVIAELGGVRLHHEVTGSGPDVVALVHGSWDDHRTWDGVASCLHSRAAVVTYDRRGHSASSAPPGQGRIGQDVDDLLALLHHVGRGPAHVVGHSYGACVAILAAARRPAAFSSVTLHEAPLFALLAADPALRPLAEEASTLMRRAAGLLEAGRVEEGVRLFVEQVAFGPGSWDTLFDDDARRTMVANAGTWLDQSRDPDRLAVDPALLARFPGPVTLTTGSATLPAFAAVVRRMGELLPAARIVTIDGAGHGAPLSHPAALAAAVPLDAAPPAG